MSLESKLAEIRTASSGRIPAAAKEVMSAATNTLRESGIVQKAIQVGDTLPAFSMTNQHGDLVASNDLLKHGAIVLTVFRGHW